jgi:hypothetical protein
MEETYRMLEKIGLEGAQAAKLSKGKSVTIGS